jgi:hypothetical protein
MRHSVINLRALLQRDLFDRVRLSGPTKLN